MAIFITGDTHGYRGLKRLCTRCRKQLGFDLGEGDYVIILGDFGLVWSAKPDRPERRWLKWLGNQPWTTLFLDGNHENHIRLGEFPVEEWHGGKIHCLRRRVYHLMRGEVYDIGGKLFFAMGGAASVDKRWREPYVSWWPEEIPSQAERANALANLAAHNWHVDYALSHCPPTDVLVRVPLAHHEMDEYSDWLQHEVADKLEFQKWFFGHMHDNIIFDDGRYELLFENVLNLDEGRSYGGPTHLIDCSVASEEEEGVVFRVAGANPFPSDSTIRSS